MRVSKIQVCKISAASALCLAWLAPSYAQEALSPSHRAFRLMSEGLRAGDDEEERRGRLRSDFAQLDANADGVLTTEDGQEHVLMDQVKNRIYSGTEWMKYDADGDGFVAEDELRVALRYQWRNDFANQPQIGRESSAAMATGAIEAAVWRLRALDADKDGKLSFGEAQNLRQSLPNEGTYVWNRIEELMTLNETGEGLARDEYIRAGMAQFRLADFDKDGQLSEGEMVTYWKKFSQIDTSAFKEQSKALLKHAAEVAEKRPPPPDLDRAGCGMPDASANAKIIILSSYQTDELSNVALGAEEFVVYAGTVVVERGSEPLYIVVSSDSPVIWQFVGETQRIERVLLSSNHAAAAGYGPMLPLVGATGLPADKVILFSESGCFPVFDKTEDDGNARAFVSKKMNREVTLTAADHSPTYFSVPSGTVDRGTERKEDGDPKSPLAELYRYSSAGWSGIDPKDVISSRHVFLYTTLPQQAGMAKLVESGALRQNNFDEYVVLKKFRFPPGLWFDHAETFIVPKGAPMPDGDWGHSCVKVDGKVVSTPNKFLSCS